MDQYQSTAWGLGIPALHRAEALQIWADSLSQYPTVSFPIHLTRVNDVVSSVSRLSLVEQCHHHYHTSSAPHLIRGAGVHLTDVLIQQPYELDNELRWREQDSKHWRA